MIYQYRCVYGHKFEAEQPFAAAPLEQCQLCLRAVERVPQSTSFSLKTKKGDCSTWGDNGYSSKGK